MLSSFGCCRTLSGYTVIQTSSLPPCGIIMSKGKWVADRATDVTTEPQETMGEQEKWGFRGAGSRVMVVEQPVDLLKHLPSEGQGSGRPPSVFIAVRFKEEDPGLIPGKGVSFSARIVHCRACPFHPAKQRRHFSGGFTQRGETCGLHPRKEGLFLRRNPVMCPLG